MIPTAFELAGLGSLNAAWYMPALPAWTATVLQPTSTTNTPSTANTPPAPKSADSSGSEFKEGLPNSKAKPFDWKVVAIPAAILVVAIGVGLVIRKRSQEA